MSPGGTPFLHQLAPQAAESLLARARIRKVGDGEVVLAAGSAGDEVLVVRSGQVRLYVDGAGGRQVILGTRGEGELIGEMAALGAMRRTASARAVGEVEAACVSAQGFKEFLTEHPDAALLLVRLLVRRLAEADQDRVALATQDSISRLAGRLLDLAGEQGKQTAQGIRIELSQEDLARWTGATRETVSRGLRLMRQLGWVSTDHSAITVIDTEALALRSGR